MAYGMRRKSITTVEGRWDFKGPQLTVGDIVRLAEQLSAGNVDPSQPIHIEPAGINGAGKEEKACFLLKPYEEMTDGRV